MAPISTSSILGCSAAVTETLSPSQLSPAVIQRIWTSFTGDGLTGEGRCALPIETGSPGICSPLRFQRGSLQRTDRKHTPGREVVGRLEGADKAVERQRRSLRFLWAVFFRPKQCCTV